MPTARAAPTDPHWHPSPNCGPRRDGLTPELVVLHYTAMHSARAALDRLCSPDHEVSAHYLIAGDGTLYQLVDEADRAWHAGAGHWAGRSDVNSRSIGIELDNSGLFPFPEPQMALLTRLISNIRARWAIPVQGVIAHSDLAPDRKSDPGRRFDWRRLARDGQAVWPGSVRPCEPASEDGFLTAAAAFGYPVDHGGALVLDAFRQRFRPWATGPLDGTDVALARDLADRFPVDRPGASA